MTTDEDLSSHEHLMVVRGFPFPFLPWLKKEPKEEALDYRPRDGDLVVAGYPKTGTVWLQYIVMQILSRGTQWNELIDTMGRVLEDLGRGVDALADRWYKTHLPYTHLRRNPNAKFVYIYRHPEDTVVSGYHFYRDCYRSPNSTLTLDAYFDLFARGAVWYGGYLDHVASFCERRGDPNILTVSYEQLQEDRNGQVLRIAAFLGEDHRAALVDSPGVLEAVVEHTGYEYMSANLSTTWPECIARHGIETGNFFRAGKVGTGKAELSAGQRRALKSACFEKLRGTGVYEEWYGDQADESV